MKRIGYELAELLECVTICHAGQFRADGKTPYIEHPIAVAGLVNIWGGGSLAVAAALSHDVKEDCSDDDFVYLVTEIKKHYGSRDAQEIVDMICALTKPGPGFGDRKARKKEAIELIREHAKINPTIIMVKCADRVHNLMTVGSKEDDFIIVYLKESTDLLMELKKMAKPHFGNYNVCLTALANQIIRIAETYPRCQL